MIMRGLAPYPRRVRHSESSVPGLFLRRFASARDEIPGERRLGMSIAHGSAGLKRSINAALWWSCAV